MMRLTLSTEHEQTVRLDSLSVEHPPLVSPPPPHYHWLSPPLLLCLSILISVVPSVSRSIFHFRFNFSDVLSTLLLRRHLSLLFCLPPLACQSVVPSFSPPFCLPPFVPVINMPRHVASACQSSYDPRQHVHHVELVHIRFAQPGETSETRVHPSELQGKAPVLPDDPNSEITKVSF